MRTGRNPPLMEALGNLQWTPKTGQLDKVKHPPVGVAFQEVRSRDLRQRRAWICRLHWPASSPLVMGHEAAGMIDAVGRDVHGFSPGDRVTFDSTVY